MIVTNEDSIVSPIVCSDRGLASIGVNPNEEVDTLTFKKNQIHTLTKQSGVEANPSGFNLWKWKSDVVGLSPIITQD